MLKCIVFATIVVAAFLAVGLSSTTDAHAQYYTPYYNDAYYYRNPYYPYYPGRYVRYYWLPRRGYAYPGAPYYPGYGPPYYPGYGPPYYPGYGPPYVGHGFGPW